MDTFNFCQIEKVPENGGVCSDLINQAQKILCSSDFLGHVFGLGAICVFFCFTSIICSTHWNSPLPKELNTPDTDLDQLLEATMPENTDLIFSIQKILATLLNHPVESLGHTNSQFVLEKLNELLPISPISIQVIGNENESKEKCNKSQLTELSQPLLSSLSLLSEQKASFKKFPNHSKCACIIL